MKKTVYKLLFTILLLGIYTIVIYAEVGEECSPSATIRETSMATPDGIEAYMPLCITQRADDKSYTEVTVNPDENIKKSKYFPDSTGMPEGSPVNKRNFYNVFDVKNYTQQVLVKKTREDNKGFNVESAKVPVCNIGTAFVRGVQTCTYTKRVDATKEEIKKTVCDDDSKDDNNNTNTGNNNGGTNTGKTPVNKNKRTPALLNDANEYIMDIKPSTLDNGILNPKGLRTDDEKKENCREEGTGKYKYKCEEEGYVLVEEGDNHYCDLADQKYEYIKDFAIKDGTTPGPINTADAVKECKSENGVDECDCPSGQAIYHFLCPNYTCKQQSVKVDTCTPSFRTPDGSAAYCVNPSQEFSTGYATTASYKRDNTFKVTSCETSYSTVDCGYANILIEGAYYHLSEKTIEFALRLWGVHTNQAGFDGVGLSLRKGVNCDSNAFYLDVNGKPVNIYVETYKEFAEVYLKNLRYRYTKIDPTKDYSDFNFGCNSSKLGVACGSGKTYKQALALLASTVIGNIEMKNQLKSLVNYNEVETVSTVELTADESGQQYIQVTYEDLENITTSQSSNKNVKINCKKLDQMVKDGEITSDTRKQIEPYCKTKAYLVDASGHRIDELGGGKPDYCYKNYCRVKVEKFAICDMDETSNSIPNGIVLSTPESVSDKTVSKYISCSNPMNNQILMAFDWSKTNGTTETTDRPGAEETTSETTTYKIMNVKCRGDCDDYSVRKTLNDTCSDDNNNYDGTYESSIKDPSLKCILNMENPAYKSIYNYSDDFEIGNKFCRVYCSDEVIYHVADKTKETSGRIFYYDIDNSIKNGYLTNTLFSNRVELKRTCTSEIYYDNTFAETVDWAKTYAFGSNSHGGSDGISQSEIDGIKNWKTLYDVLVKKARTEGGRIDNVNKVLYDLLNCNLYTDDQIEAAGISKPKKYKSKNIITSIKEKFAADKNYGIGQNSNCEIKTAKDPKNSKNTCLTMNNVSYNFGASPNGKTAYMKSQTTISNSTNNIVYCTGVSCFDYDSDHKDKEYDYPTSGANKTKTLDLSKDGLKLDKDNNNTSVTIPTNDYAIFSITANVSFYNNSRYEVKPNGEVIYKDTEKGKDYLELAPYVYTADHDAYNTTECTDRDFLNGDYRRCKIYQIYDKIELFFRHNPGDEFYSEVNLNKKFGCFVDVEKPDTVECDPSKYGGKLCQIGTIYRNVDVGNIFPSSPDGFTTRQNSNWATYEGRKATQDIEQTADTIRTTDEQLQYRIVLTPEQIKNVKEYNKENTTGYVNEEKLNCQIKGNTYQECISPFLEQLRKDDVYGTMDPNYNGKK